MTREKILPQANSLDTVIRVFMFAAFSNNLNLDEVASFCEFAPRQASYYLNACYYLDLLDENWKVTPFGNSIIERDPDMKRAVYERIITDPVIGKVFAHMMLFPNDDIIEFTIKLLTPLYPEYGDAVISRRASTLKSWCDEIIKELQ